MNDQTQDCFLTSRCGGFREWDPQRRPDDSMTYTRTNLCSNLFLRPSATRTEELQCYSTTGHIASTQEIIWG